MAHHQKYSLIHIRQYALLRLSYGGDLTLLIPALTIRAFFATRRQFAQVLSNSASGLNMSRYFRLMALAATEMTCALPLSIYILVSNLKTFPPQPWISWDATHIDFDHIEFLPQALFDAAPDQKSLIDLSRWLSPAGAFLFFTLAWLARRAKSISKYSGSSSSHLASSRRLPSPRFPNGESFVAP
jgi:hypothetical protein